jgi:hypothetical protein
MELGDKRDQGKPVLQSQGKVGTPPSPTIPTSTAGEQRGHDPTGTTGHIHCREQWKRQRETDHDGVQ